MATVNGTNFNDNNTFNGIPFIFRPALNGVIDSPFLDLPDTINGFDGNDILNGLGTNDTLNGGAGNDTLNGGAGNDVLNGGAGVDTTNGGSGNDRIIDTDFINFDVHDGGTGIDTIDYSGVTFSSGAVTINLATSTASVSGGNTETIRNFENVEGSQGGETIIGSAANNVLNGNGGNDTINGGAGVDTTNGGSGNDRIIDTDFVNFDVHDGGTGIDTIDYSQVTFGSGVTINLATSTTSVSGGNTETIRNFENVEGSQGGETIIGSAANNVLNGNGGNDTINGGAGVDTTNGGSGNDRIIDTDFVNFDVHDGGTGIDTIDYSQVTFGSGVTINLATSTTSVSGGNTETIRNFENVEGSQGGETIIGSAADNVLNGNGGNDTIFGGAGNDTLTGGNGNDILVGGAGKDTMSDQNGDDIYRFFSTSESAVGAQRDVIIDFTRGFDKLDLSFIDADLSIAGDQAFTFIGTNNFSGARGEVRFFTSGSNLIVQAEINGDGNITADMEIQLNGLASISAADFIL